MDTIEESKEGSLIESITDNQSTKSESSTTTTRKAERRSERQRAKRQLFANGQSESKEDTSDRKTEQKHKSITPRRILSSDYSSEEGEREDPPSRPGSAYEIYKRAGDWWKYVLNFIICHIFLNYAECLVTGACFYIYRNLCPIIYTHRHTQTHTHTFNSIIKIFIMKV